MEYRSGNRLPQDNGDRRNFFGILGGTVQGAGLEAARAGYNDGSLIADAAEKGGFTRTAPDGGTSPLGGPGFLVHSRSGRIRPHTMRLLRVSVPVKVQLLRTDFWNAEAATNFPDEIVRDLGMARNCFDGTVRRVNPQRMRASFTLQETAIAPQVLQQAAPLHAARISTVMVSR